MKEVPQSHDSYFHPLKTDKELLGTENEKITSSTNILLYQQQPPVEAPKGIVVTCDLTTKITFMSLFSNWQVEPINIKSGSAANDKPSSPGLSWI